jgi:hypothetical protein
MFVDRKISILSISSCFDYDFNMEKFWPEKYRIYDVSIKLDAIARYEAGGLSLNNLATEIGVNATPYIRESEKQDLHVCH